MLPQFDPFYYLIISTATGSALRFVWNIQALIIKPLFRLTIQDKAPTLRRVVMLSNQKDIASHLELKTTQKQVD